jgi:hypothetical protein
MEWPAHHPDLNQKEVKIRCGLNHSQPYQENLINKSLLSHRVICVFLEFQDAPSGDDIRAGEGQGGGEVYYCFTHEGTYFYSS